MKKYYVEYLNEEKNIIKNYTDSSEDAVDLGYKDIIEGDFNIISYKDYYYTPEQFKAVENSDEYKAEKAKRDKDTFDYESKQMEDDALYVEYKGKKISLDEILFKSLFYSSVTDLYVYLRAEDQTIFKMTRTSFLLLITKAKTNLKATEEALYNAQQNYDPSKTLEESIQALKSVIDSINKIFND